MAVLRKAEISFAAADQNTPMTKMMVVTSRFFRTSPLTPAARAKKMLTMPFGY